MEDIFVPKKKKTNVYECEMSRRDRDEERGWWGETGER